jgi:hypothetical protein
VRRRLTRRQDLAPYAPAAEGARGRAGAVWQPAHPPGRGRLVPSSGGGGGRGAVNCGFGSYGELGLGDEQPRRRLTRVPQAVFAGSRVVMVSCGRFLTMAATGHGRHCVLCVCLCVCVCVCVCRQPSTPSCDTKIDLGVIHLPRHPADLTQQEDGSLAAG